METTLYEISFPNSEQREAEIEVRFRALPHGPLRVRMARSSPGRYALHEFAKNVYSVRATDADGRALDVTRDSPHSWIVTGHTGDVRFSYTLFADRADGTYSGVDLTRAHLNMPATFAWAPALASRPIQITFVSPDPTWTIATQLDDYMRALWQEFGRAQNVDLAPVRGYTIADAERVLATVSGDAAFARDFFARYVIGSELPDFPALLARAGLLVQQANPNGAWLGDNLLGVQGDGLLVVGSTTIGSPMHAIGLSARDHLLIIDGAALGSVEAYHAALAAKRPGDEIVLTWRGRTGERRATVRLLADPRVEVRAFEEAGRTPTAEQLAFRESWLKSAHR